MFRLSEAVGKNANVPDEDKCLIKETPPRQLELVKSFKSWTEVDFVMMAKVKEKRNHLVGWPNGNVIAFDGFKYLVQ